MPKNMKDDEGMEAVELEYCVRSKNDELEQQNQKSHMASSRAVKRFHQKLELDDNKGDPRKGSGINMTLQRLANFGRQNGSKEKKQREQNKPNDKKHWKLELKQNESKTNLKSKERNGHPNGSNKSHTPACETYYVYGSNDESGSIQTVSTASYDTSAPSVSTPSIYNNNNQNQFNEKGNQDDQTSHLSVSTHNHLTNKNDEKDITKYVLNEEDNMTVDTMTLANAISPEVYLQSSNMDGVVPSVADKFQDPEQQAKNWWYENFAGEEEEQEISAYRMEEKNYDCDVDDDEDDDDHFDDDHFDDDDSLSFDISRILQDDESNHNPEDNLSLQSSQKLDENHFYRFRHDHHDPSNPLPPKSNKRTVDTRDHDNDDDQRSVLFIPSQDEITSRLRNFFSLSPHYGGSTSVDCCSCLAMENLSICIKSSKHIDEGDTLITDTINTNKHDGKNIKTKDYRKWYYSSNCFDKINFTHSDMEGNQVVDYNFDENEDIKRLKERQDLMMSSSLLVPSLDEESDDSKTNIHCSDYNRISSDDYPTHEFRNGDDNILGTSKYLPSSLLHSHNGKASNKNFNLDSSVTMSSDSLQPNDLLSSNNKTRNDILELLYNWNEGSERVKELIDSDYSIATNVLNSSEQLPLHIVCDRRFPVCSVKRNSHVSYAQPRTSSKRTKSFHSADVIEVSASVQKKKCFPSSEGFDLFINDLINDINDHLELLKIVAGAHLNACSIPDSNGDLPVHLLSRRLLEWQQCWTAEIKRAKRWYTITDTNAARFITLHQVIAKCVEVVLRPISLSSRHCQMRGSMGSMLPIHIATLFGVTYDTLRQILERFPQGAGIPFDAGESNNASSKLSMQLPLEILENLKETKDVAPTGNQCSESLDPHSSGVRWSKSIDDYPYEEDFIRRSDLIFAFYPNIKPFQNDEYRLRRVEKTLRAESKQRGDYGLKVELSPAMKNFWIWICTYDSDKENHNYQESVRRVVEGLDSQSINKLIEVQVDETTTIMQIAISSCAKIISDNLMKTEDTEVIGDNVASTVSRENKLAKLEKKNGFRSILKAGKITDKTWKPINHNQDMGRLCKVLFNVKEDSFPTSFVVLPYRLKIGASGFPTLDSSSDIKVAKLFADNLLKMTDASKLVYLLQKKFNSVLGVQLPIKAMRDWRSVQQSLHNDRISLLDLYKSRPGFFYFIDESTGIPLIPKDSSGNSTYPIVINNATIVVEKLLPLMCMGMTLMRGGRALLTLAQVIEMSLPQFCPYSWIEAAQDIVNYMYSQNSISSDSRRTEYSSSDMLHDNLIQFVSEKSSQKHKTKALLDDGSEWLIELSFLKIMLENFDAKRNFMGLKRMKTKNGSKLWTVDSVRQDLVHCPQTNLDIMFDDNSCLRPQVHLEKDQATVSDISVASSSISLIENDETTLQDADSDEFSAEFIETLGDHSTALLNSQHQDNLKKKNSPLSLDKPNDGNESSFKDQNSIVGSAMTDIPSISLSEKCMHEAPVTENSKRDLITPCIQKNGTTEIRDIFFISDSENDESERESEKLLGLKITSSYNEALDEDDLIYSKHFTNKFSSDSTIGTNTEGSNTIGANTITTNVTFWTDGRNVKETTETSGNPLHYSPSVETDVTCWSESDDSKIFLLNEKRGNLAKTPLVLHSSDSNILPPLDQDERSLDGRENESYVSDVSEIEDLIYQQELGKTTSGNSASNIPSKEESSKIDKQSKPLETIVSMEDDNFSVHELFNEPLRERENSFSQDGQLKQREDIVSIVRNNDSCLKNNIDDSHIAKSLDSQDSSSIKLKESEKILIRSDEEDATSSLLCKVESLEYEILDKELTIEQIKLQLTAKELSIISGKNLQIKRLENLLYDKEAEIRNLSNLVEKYV